MISLFPYQEPVVDQIDRALRRHGSALQASSTGVGKTVMTLETCRRHGWRPAVICPKSVVPSWERTAKAMGLDPMFVINYEMLRTGRTPWLTKIGAGKRMSFRWKVPDEALLIWDEQHRCKGYSSQNCKMHLAHTEQGLASISLSATIADNPMHMKAIGSALGLFNHRDYIQWMLDNGVRQGYFGGYVFPEKNAARYLPALHAAIFPDRGARLRKADIPGFPETQITAECYDVGVKKLAPELAALAAEYNALAESALMDGTAGLAFTLRLRQATEVAKLPTLLELAEDYLAEGNSVVIFVSFRHSIEYLAKNISVKDPAIIWGGQNDREENLARFQENRTRVCLVQIGAGGAGLDLHDTDGAFPRAVLVCPNYSAQDLTQALGRVHRATAKSKSIQRIVFAAGTLEEDICAAVSGKLDRLDMLNDGDIINAIFKNKQEK